MSKRRNPTSSVAAVCSRDDSNVCADLLIQRDRFQRRGRVVRFVLVFVIVTAAIAAGVWLSSFMKKYQRPMRPPRLEAKFGRPR